MKERQKELSQQKNPRKWGMILLMAVLIIVMLVLPVEHFRIPVRRQEKRKSSAPGSGRGLGDHYRKRQYGFERYKKGKRREGRTDTGCN